MPSSLPSRTDPRRNHRLLGRQHAGENEWPHRSNRREFIRDLGIGAAALPFVLNLPSLGFANQQRRKQRLVVMFSPNGVVPNGVLARRGRAGRSSSRKASSRSSRSSDRTLILHGVCDKVRGDGDNHMRGIGCLLTGVELFPGNIQGGSDTPAGWARGISIDQEIKNYLQSRPETRTRFGSLEFGVMVPDRADTWTRMVYAGPNKPLAPIDDPYQMFGKLYGRVKDQESLKSVLDELKDDLKKVSAVVSAEDRQLLDEHATFVREMEQELKDSQEPRRRARRSRARAGREARNDNIPKISKMQIDLMVNSFAADFARVATLQYTNSVGRRQDALARHQRRPSRALAQARQRQEGAGEAHQDQQVVLRAAGLPGQAAGRDARAGRRRQPARQHARSSGPTSWARATRTRSTTSRSSWSATASTSRWAARSSTRRCRTTGCCWRWPTAWATTSNASAIPTSAAAEH